MHVFLLMPPTCGREVICAGLVSHKALFYAEIDEVLTQTIDFPQGFLNLL
jgi:hypothetical protein